jgi:hypothetical protein
VLSAYATGYGQSAVRAEATPAQQPVTPANGPELTVDQIIARYIEARGGAEKLHAINTMRLTRTIMFKSADPGASGQTYTMVTEFKRPNLSRTEIRVPQGISQLATYDGSQGWTTNAKEPVVTQVSAEKASKTPSFSDIVEGEFVDYQQKGYTVTLRGMAQSQGKDCYGLLTTKPNGQVTYRCLDKVTFLDLERRDENTTTLVSDFTPVAGVLVAHRIEAMSKEGTWIYTTDKVELNVELEEARFQKPAPLPQFAAAAPVTATGETFKRVQWARQTVSYTLQQVRTCDPLPFKPICSFAAQPEKIKFTKDRIEFWAPLNKSAGGPRAAFIDLTSVPKLTPKMREGWRVLDPTWWYYSFDPADKKYAADSSNILWGKAKLEWKTIDPANQFLKALEILTTNAHGKVDAEEREALAFAASAREWRELAAKPPMPEPAHEQKVLAEYAIQQGQYEQALQHYEKGLEIYPLWPEGQHNAAAIAAQLGNYECAIEHTRYFLELAPDAPDAGNLKDSIIVWKNKLESK